MPQLITDSYRDLNAELHEGVKYGTGSYRWDQMVLSLRDEVMARTVLDYGCGKGNLRKALEKPDWITEYDPAVKGKDAPPKDRADLVVCTDVLEHIEPDLLDNVLNHIKSLTRKLVFVVIATRESSQSLSDGRNAHLIIEDADWWKAKIADFFRVVTWHSDGGEVVCTLQPAHRVQKINIKSAVSDDIRLEQAKLNITKTDKRLGVVSKAHEKGCIIVAYGPSLRDNWPFIVEERLSTGKPVVSMSGSHNFLIERGVVPDIHIDVDPREHKGWFTREPHKGVAYWMASCLHPSVIDNLLAHDADLTLWHVLNSEVDMELFKIEPDALLMAGGGSVGCRAVNVMYCQGYRRFSIYGMDCSFDDGGTQHAGEHSGKVQRQMHARCGDRWFKTSGTLVAIARGFLSNARALDQNSKNVLGEKVIEGLDTTHEMILHGDGLLQQMVKESSGGREPGIEVSADELADTIHEPWVTPDEAA